MNRNKKREPGRERAALRKRIGPEPVRILILEDNPVDAELIQFELQEGGFNFTAKAVMTERDFVHELQEYAPDLILSDYDLPKYNGALALAEAIGRCPDIPFILVTGAIAEDRAVEILTQGAKDYVLKTRLQQRLVPAVRRALNEAEEQKARKQAEEELREAHRTLEEKVAIRTAELHAEIEARKQAEEALRKSESVLRAFFDGPGMFRGIVDMVDDDIRYVSVAKAAAAVYGLTPDAVCGRLFSDLGVPPVIMREYINRCEETRRTGSPVSFEVFRHLADGRRCLLVTVSYMGAGPTGCPRFAYATLDITERKRAEEALQVSEIKYRELYQSMTDAFVSTDMEGHIKDYNESYLNMLGYAPEEINGLTYRDITPEKWRATEDAIVEKQVLVRGYSDIYEKEYRRKDGTVFPVELRTTLLRDNADTPISMWAIVHDITERKRAEYEATILAEIGRTISSTLEINEVYERVAAEIRKLISFDSLVVNLCDAHHETLGVAYVSGLDIPGRRVGDSFPLRGTIMEEVIRTRGGVIVQSENPQDLADRFPLLIVSVQAGMRSVMCVPLISRDEVIGNLSMRSQEPGAYTEQNLLLAEKVGMQIAPAIANARLFKDLKQIEKTLRENEKRYRELNDFLPIAIFEVDSAGNLLSFNRTALETFRYKEEDYEEGMNVIQFFSPEEGQRLGEDLRKAIQGTPAYGREYTFMRKDGTTFIGLIYASPIIHQQETRGLRGTIIDITERKRAEQEKRSLEERLHRAEKMEALGQLAGGVAHDLNNVLGVSTVYAELLQEKIPAEGPLRKYVDNILSSSQKGAAIIEDLLTLARRGVTVSEVMNLNGIVSTFLKTPVFEKIQAYHPNVIFTTACQAELLQIKGSPLHLEKTVMNLVSNAAEAISGKGEVTIRTENRYLDKPIGGYDEVMEGDYAVLTVSDTGMGIPAENIGKIFEPFYTKKTMGRSGTGLGLAIVWGTVKDHNGYIDIQTEPEKGTTFTLYFPVTREDPGGQQQKRPVERYMGNGESVLVVDDVAEQRDVAATLLTRLGYRVHAVASGEEAVETLKRNTADILVLDMIMTPGIDGLETYKRVLEINPRQKAIIVSGFSETERVREAQELGAGAYVRKPYLMEKIGTAIRSELRKE